MDLLGPYIAVVCLGFKPERKFMSLRFAYKYNLLQFQNFVVQVFSGDGFLGAVAAAITSVRRTRFAV
jgi:hypothetical protein